MEGLSRALAGEPADLTSAQKAARRVFSGQSELAALGRSYAWSSSALGPVDRWPEALNATVRLMLGSPTPTSLWVGQEFTVLYNDAFARLIGTQHPRAFGSAGTGICAAESWPDFRQRLEQVRAGGQPIHVDAARLPVARRTGDEDAWFAYSLSALTDADGQCIAIYNVAVEVTEQVLAHHEVESLLGESQRARAEAVAARSAAEAANRAKSEFLATMSHELRTPLNAVVGYAQLLGMGVLGPATPAQHAHLERLQASARHLLRLVEDVLDVAKVDADRLDVRRDSLVTGAAVAAAVALVQPQATTKGVRLVDLGTGTSGVPFTGDEHRVRQVLVNLLSNAVKFTPPGGQVTVECGATDEPEPGVRRPDTRREAPLSSAAPWAFVRVEDTGPGIEPDQVEQLFEPFVQGDNALTREQGGTGLGLTISRRLARLMGGDVNARNRLGSGAAFTLWLPGSLPSAPSTAVVVDMDARRTTPRGTASVVDPVDAPLDEQGFAIVYALGARLAADAEIVAERYTRKLRADLHFPGAHDLPDCQLRNHATPTVGLLASQLMTIGETHGRAPELLADGGQMQRVMAELHGVQRHRLGWSEADIEHETPLLLAEVERILEGALESEPVNVSVRSHGGLDVEISGQSLRKAARYAADVSRYVFEQSTRIALRSYRFAKAAETP